MPSRRKSKFSIKIIRWVVREILRRGGEATTNEIKGELAAKYRHCPTSNQLSQILSRSGFFIKHDLVARKTFTGNNMKVHLWGVDEDACADHEWYQAEVDAIAVWAAKKGDGGSAKGGWDAPSRIGNKKGKPRKPRASDSETDNNSVE